MARNIVIVDGMRARSCCALHICDLAGTYARARPHRPKRSRGHHRILTNDERMACQVGHLCPTDSDVVFVQSPLGIECEVEFGTADHHVCDESWRAIYPRGINDVCIQIKAEICIQEMDVESVSKILQSSRAATLHVMQICVIDPDIETEFSESIAIARSAHARLIVEDILSQNPPE